MFQDYEHELICVTEREKFIVPVRAIGARAILDFPDDVHFPICPVKYPNNRTLLIRNIGNREAKFTLETEKSVDVWDICTWRSIGIFSYQTKPTQSAMVGL